ncbi:MAG: class I adenylate-forming enzyme family protein [Acidimicrobiales bacterium]
MNMLTRARLTFCSGETLGTMMQSLADVHGNRRLITDMDGRTLTYHQAAKRVARWAGGIAAVTEPGDRVVLHTTNNYELFLLVLAAARAGRIAVPINPQMRHDEVAHVVADSGAPLVVRTVHQVDGSEPITEAAAADPEDVAALFYTSGTTGKPKGAELTHRALVGQLTAGVAWPAMLHRDEVVFALPIAHIMGFSVLMGLACLGVPVYLLPSFRPVEVLDAIEQRRATVFIGVPAMYRMMEEAGAEHRDLTSVRIWGSGADAMPADLARRFKKMGASATLPVIGPVGEAAFVEGYGMVEVGGGVAAKVSPPMLNLGLGESIGFQLPSYRFRVVDDQGAEVRTGLTGELWVQGPGVIKGYWNAPEISARTVTDDGWLRTGDLVRKGPLGTVLFVGRQKDVIKHAGYSVYAVEVQEVLERHPAVLEAVVVGLPDRRPGEIPAAVVRLSDGIDLADIELEAWASEHLSRYKVPRRFVAVDELPRTGTNKVQKQDLLALF